MHNIQAVWDFIQHHVLGMRWLDRLIGNMLLRFGLDTNNRWVAVCSFYL